MAMIENETRIRPRTCPTHGEVKAEKRLPAALQQIAEAFPLQHLVAAMSHGFLPGASGVAWGDLAIVATWGAAGLALALRRFRWTPVTAAA